MEKICVISFVGFILLLMGCKQDVQYSGLGNNVVFKTEKMSFKDGSDCDVADSLMNECAILNISKLIPASTNDRLNKAVTDSIEYYIKSMVGECIWPEELTSLDRDISLDTMAKMYFAQHQSFVKDFPDAGAKVWNIDIDIDSTFQNTKVLCLSVNGYTFLGGAHPNNYTSFLNFDKSSGKTLQLSDFIKDMEAFRKIAETEFRKNQELSENQDLEEAGYFFENGVYSLPAQFAISDKGIFLFYNAYEAAAYVVGQISFNIPYDAITPIAALEKIK